LEREKLEVDKIPDVHPEKQQMDWGVGRKNQKKVLVGERKKTKKKRDLGGTVIINH